MGAFTIRFGTWLRWCFCIASAVLALSPTSSPAQVSGTTATLRGSVEDASGGVLPGAAITLVNINTRATRTAVTDERGAFTFSSLFPGAYDLSVELSGFKTTVEVGIVLGPNDTRGIAVRLEIGSQHEVVTVRAAQAEVMQTETGAREGVLTASQIDSLSVIGRSSLELVRILPGVVAPDQNQLESVSFLGGANSIQSYTVNGIRSSSSNAVSLDGSNLVDFGANSGVMVGLNNDMVQEVKIQTSNFGAEFGSGATNVSAVTKSGSSRFTGSLYDYIRDWRFAANDRSNSIAGIEKLKSRFMYAGGNIGGPLPLFGYNARRDRLFFWFGLEVQRQQLDSGSQFSTTISEAARTGDLSEFLANRGQNLNHPTTVLIPAGYPGAGSPAPNNNLAPYVTPLGRVMAGLYPLPNHTDPNNRYNYVYSALEPTNRLEMKMRFDWNIHTNTKAYVRIARDSEEVTSPRGTWGGVSPRSALALPTAGLATNRGRSYAGHIVSVLSPTMTNESLVTFSRLTLDTSYEHPSKLRLDAQNVEFEGIFPGQSPYVPANANFGGSQLGVFGAFVNDVYAHNDELLFGNRLTKIRGTHLLKFGVTIGRYQKQQNANNAENGSLVTAPGTPGGTGSQIGNLLVGRPAQIVQGTRAKDTRFRMWNVDLFAQDSWKIRSTLTLEYGVRAGYWTNNAEQNGLGNWFDSTLYDRGKGTFIDPEYTQLNGVRYASRGQAPLGLFPNRNLFALPRVNLAWDISGNGVSVLRGGYGVFANRPMGNVEYNPVLNNPPNAYRVTADAFYDTTLGGTGLTYDTVHLIPFTALLGSQSIMTPTPRSFTFPRTASYSVSFARRIFWAQVIEGAYVGTRGRDLVSRIASNVVPLGSLSSGVLGNADLSIPVNRVNLDPSVVNSRRPFPAYGQIYTLDYEGRSQYHSLQVTLSRQAATRFQYLAAYTLSQTRGTLRGEYADRDPFDVSRTYGVLDQDRRHILNLSWNALLPDASRGLPNALGRSLLDGWRLSGISTFTSGIPIRLAFGGDAATPGISQAYFGTPDVVGTAGPSNGLAPEFVCDPRLGGSAVGEKILDIGCIKVPDFGTNAPLIAPYDLRTPFRMNHDLTLFKTFAVHGAQKLQFRVGFFNIFNAAHAATGIHNDIDLLLDTTCKRRVDHVPNGIGGYADGVCDPAAGYAFTDGARKNFGKINVKRGHRVVQFVLKYYF